MVAGITKILKRRRTDTLEKSSGSEVQPRDTEVDRLYAILRRLDKRIKDLEINASALRRDVNRVERKQLREVPATNSPAGLIVTQQGPGWYGLAPSSERGGVGGDNQGD